MLKKSLLIILLLFISGCSTKHPPLTTVNSVNINKYLGTWYEIARYEHFFEKGCKNVTATYTLNKDNTLKVVNKCTKIDTNKKSSATGVAYATSKSNSKLKVSFFRPFYGDYWILMLDKNYKYAVVGSPSREYLWILSRTSKLNKKSLNKILEKLPKLGFPTEKLIWTIQE
ncbi:hypothetical protein CP960_03205 [Malaciobacter halophilus]|uniref:Lipocalin/cytosolic fatty-acid binding domain-containing protein n=1 Tax=Malaciobacter halophilus TaxID=197482 RepID=A0A2N1J573_9BACT|nr:lipocalin family protein [Malaciobacter halophilus]AXH09620.1 lipocalin domain-containing protein [Malaciobacter halophilus]PKI81612.1 hypothetical protein CP960_03205 [Malaciobacter halophilus]